MVSTAGTAVSVFPEWRFPNAGLRGHGGRNIQPGMQPVYPGTGPCVSIHAYQPRPLLKKIIA